MKRAGMDEAGYGAHLGPFVVAAISCESEPGDLWRMLAPTLTRCGRGGLAVGDSKKIFSQEKGIRSLEPVVLAFLDVPLEDLTLRRLERRLGMPPDPWDEGEDLELPCHAGREEVERCRERVQEACRRAEVRFLSASVRALDAAEFNARLSRLGNKHSLHAEVVLDLAAPFVGSGAEVFAGKLSGRTRYLGLLTEKFRQPVFAQHESRGRSSYVFPQTGARIHFLRDGEDREFTVGLASMIAKYVRECRMRTFRRFWSRRLAGVRPSAGYGTDGMRFFRELAPNLPRLSLSREQVLRLK